MFLAWSTRNAFAWARRGRSGRPDRQEPTSTTPKQMGEERDAVQPIEGMRSHQRDTLPWGVTPPMTDRWSRVCHSSRTGVSPRGA